MQQAKIETNYTPFLMELYPCTNKIKLFSKSLIDENDDEINRIHE